ncbi:MAG: NAD-dependent epimerase/dehydratase family protein [Hymenobacteraceae bacterium]|nr:NAD-dependent epimerase/dehydratase family protein [Hymenobacteraceae bacterium]MDX5395553.1 NAD-dependent epimerase/dehydratase family protein [Hymenobacteraceae bacterium]MDX5443979.1 NAD-dependent epimerase/dehydratase family protein [Hymenobacteraceae bacterium]MDX5511607.1 NAD-dependent epimerase/dehydratase family protein [Hymenobacteraceae bacterium]
MADTILVIGACGQLGSELTMELRNLYGGANVIAADISVPKQDDLRESGPFEKVDVLDAPHLSEIVKKHKFTQIYHLAAVLSATGERNPKFAWRLNMDGLFHVLDLAVEKNVGKVYWPSSIAVFGPNTPRQNTPQHTIMDPNTVYGISKQAGERWCEYYFEKKGLDVRSLRYPGLIGYKALPGGGTTDYAVDIYHKALENGSYECFLSEDTYLPMMYMPDALKATLDLMHAPAEEVKVRSSYNLSAMSFSPKEIAESIRRQIPDFEITYNPDYRQQIADSWPQSIDDSAAQQDWHWKPQYDLDAMTDDMLLNLKKMKTETVNQ